MDILKISVNEVERQFDRKIKVMRSGRGGEYYCKFDKSGQCPGLFAKFFESQAICVEYTLLDMLKQIGVAKR